MAEPPLRPGKRARTRASLIETAARVIGEKGFEGATLEEISARAGMTHGAIYGNFKNRDELFLAVIEARWRPVLPPWRLGASLRDQLEILGRATAEAARARRAIAVGVASFKLYVLTHEEIRHRVAREHARIYQAAARALVEIVDESELPMPAEAFVCVLHALGEGLVFTHFLAPELITEEVIVQAFTALA